jgi:hypothetical protein
MSADAESGAAVRLPSGPVARIVVVVVLFCSFIWAWNVVAGMGVCTVENSGCALAGPPRLWLGRVFTRAAAGATVHYYFSSLASAGRLRPEPVKSFETLGGRI